MSSSGADKSAGANGDKDKERRKAEMVQRDFLSVVHDIVRSVEKDYGQDTKAKERASLAAMKRVDELHNRLEKTRGDLHLLPGIEMSKEQQRRRLDVLQRQIQLKKELIARYKAIDYKATGFTKAIERGDD